MKKHVTLQELAYNICMDEAEVLSMVESGELPKPNTNGLWKWAAVDAAMMADDSHCRVYFVAFMDFIKIGFTTDLEQRMESLAGFLPMPPVLLLDIAGSYDLETDLHRRFAHLRAGGEWFRKAPELTEYIEQIKNTNDLKIRAGES